MAAVVSARAGDVAGLLMAIVAFECPDGTLCYALTTGVIGITAAFQWSETVTAREVTLTNGKAMLVLDTADNVTMALKAMDATDDQVAIAMKTIGATAAIVQADQVKSIP